MSDPTIVELHQSEDGGFTATIPTMPGCISEGDDICESLRNLAAAAALWGDSGDQVAAQLLSADFNGHITFHTSREYAGDVREELTAWIEPTLEEDDPAQLQTLTITQGGMQMAITHLAPEPLTRIGLFLIDAASRAAAKR